MLPLLGGEGEPLTDKAAALFMTLLERKLPGS